MAKLQSYKDGKIDRTGNIYSYVVNGKVKGVYNSITELVKGVYDGEQEAKQKAVKRKRRTAKKVEEVITEVSEPEQTEVEETS